MFRWDRDGELITRRKRAKPSLFSPYAKIFFNKIEAIMIMLEIAILIFLTFLYKDNKEGRRHVINYISLEYVPLKTQLGKNSDHH